MPATSTTIYTCDRDGTVSEPSTTGLPPGWASANVMVQVTPPPPDVEGQTTTPPPMSNASLILCPACSTIFTDTLSTFRVAGAT